MKWFSVLVIFMSINVYPKVAPPNYNFSLDSLKKFSPGTALETIKKEFGNGEIYSKSGDFLIIRYKISQLRYLFPLFIQVYKGKVVDFFARLPAYFSHDLFHQSIINRYGPQTGYKKYEESATYTWKNIKGNRIVYRGACTITCFTVHFAIYPNSPPKEAGGYIPLIIKFQNAIPSIDKP